MHMHDPNWGRSLVRSLTLDPLPPATLQGRHRGNELIASHNIGAESVPVSNVTRLSHHRDCCAIISCGWTKRRDRSNGVLAASSTYALVFSRFLGEARSAQRDLPRRDARVAKPGPQGCEG